MLNTLVNIATRCNSWSIHMAAQVRPSLASQADEFLQNNTVSATERANFMVLFNSLDTDHDRKFSTKEMVDFVASLLHKREEKSSEKARRFAESVRAFMDSDDDKTVDVEEFTNVLVVITGHTRGGARGHRLACGMDPMECVRAYFQNTYEEFGSEMTRYYEEQYNSIHYYGGGSSMQHVADVLFSETTNGLSRTAPESNSQESLDMFTKWREDVNKATFDPKLLKVRLEASPRDLRGFNEDMEMFLKLFRLMDVVNGNVLHRTKLRQTILFVFSAFRHSGLAKYLLQSCMEVLMEEAKSAEDANVQKASFKGIANSFQLLSYYATGPNITDIHGTGQQETRDVKNDCYFACFEVSMLAHIRDTFLIPLHDFDTSFRTQGAFAPEELRLAMMHGLRFLGAFASHLEIPRQLLSKDELFTFLWEHILKHPVGVDDPVTQDTPKPFINPPQYLCIYQAAAWLLAVLCGSNSKDSHFANIYFEQQDAIALHIDTLMHRLVFPNPVNGATSDHAAIDPWYRWRDAHATKLGGTVSAEYGYSPSLDFDTSFALTMLNIKSDLMFASRSLNRDKFGTTSDDTAGDWCSRNQNLVVDWLDVWKRARPISHSNPDITRDYHQACARVIRESLDSLTLLVAKNAFVKKNFIKSLDDERYAYVLEMMHDRLRPMNQIVAVEFIVLMLECAGISDVLVGDGKIFGALLNILSSVEDGRTQIKAVQCLGSLCHNYQADKESKLVAFEAFVACLRRAREHDKLYRETYKVPANTVNWEKVKHCVGEIEKLVLPNDDEGDHFQFLVSLQRPILDDLYRCIMEDLRPTDTVAAAWNSANNDEYTRVRNKLMTIAQHILDSLKSVAVREGIAKVEVLPCYAWSNVVAQGKLVVCPAPLPINDSDKLALFAKISGKVSQSFLNSILVKYSSTKKGDVVEFNNSEQLYDLLTSSGVCEKNDTTKAHAQQLFNLMDENGDGKVSMEELLVYCNRHTDQGTGNIGTDHKAFFDFLDADKSGSLNRSEFARAIKACSPGEVSNEHINHVFDLFDTNKDGQIEFTEIRDNPTNRAIFERYLPKINIFSKKRPRDDPQAQHVSQPCETYRKSGRCSTRNCRFSHTCQYGRSCNKKGLPKSNPQRCNLKHPTDPHRDPQRPPGRDDPQAPQASRPCKTYRKSGRCNTRNCRFSHTCQYGRSCNKKGLPKSNPQRCNLKH